MKYLDKVERNYVIELPDKTQLNPENGVEFIKAFMKDFIYGKCRKDFYGNPKILFAPKSYAQISPEGASYLSGKNAIVFSPEIIIEKAYHRNFDKKYTEEEMNQIIEMNLVIAVIHELSHSMEYRFYKNYKSDEKIQQLVECEIEYDAVPRFFRRHEEDLKEYLGYNIYMNLDKTSMSKDTIEKYREKFTEVGDVTDFDDSEIVMTAMLMYTNSHPRYKKQSSFNHLFKDVLQYDMRRSKKQIKFVKDKVFKENYSIKIAVPEGQNNIDSEEDEVSFEFIKEDFCNVDRYVRLIPRLVEHLAATDRLYNICKDVNVEIGIKEEEKELLITFTYLSYSNLWNAIQYK